MGAGILVQVIAPVDGRRRPLHAIEALTGAAADADFVKTIAPLQVDRVGIDELMGVTQLTPRPRDKNRFGKPYPLPPLRTVQAMQK